MRKAVFILMLILCIAINVFTLWLILPDFFFPKRSVYVTKQDDYIVEIVKEYFRIEYDISKIVYQQSFPNGYSLDIYNVVGETDKEFKKYSCISLLSATLSVSSNSLSVSPTTL